MAKPELHDNTFLVLSYAVLRTLPFSNLEKTISVRPKGYPERPKSISEHLIKLRVDMKLTKVAMAKLIGIAASVLTNWEQGRCKPDAIRMKKVIDFIGYNPFKS